MSRAGGISRRKGSVSEMIGGLMNSMKNCKIQSKKIIVALLTFGLLVSLSGCTLAVEDAGRDKSRPVNRSIHHEEKHQFL